jgi:diguanylate cyclase (GGDEF)-like protein
VKRCDETRNGRRRARVRGDEARRRRRMLRRNVAAAASLRHSGRAARPGVRMSFELFPRNDPNLRRLLRRQLMGFASYLMFLVPLVYAVNEGWMRMDFSGLAWFVAAACAVNVIFFVLIRAGWTRGMQDPGLTLAQIATAMALALVMIHYSGEARSVLLMLFFAALFFGIFGLGTRQFLLLGTAAAVGYWGLIHWEFRDAPDEDPRRRLEILRLLTLSMIMLWMALLGSYVAGLRQNLRRRNAELAEAMARLRTLVAHDELTGAFNRRHLLDILHREKERADRFGHVFTVCIIDLDHFKRINDNHGHAAGDDVLRGFTERMLASARKIDWLGRQDVDTTFGRYGGEEFLLVMPHTPLAGARVCIERIRDRVVAAPFETGAGPLEANFSAGVAEHRPGETVADTLGRADEALYLAKTRGRGRTEIAA